MGGCIGSLATCCLCNTASCCLQGICSCCGKATSAVSKSVMTRVLYCVQLALMAFIAWLLSNIPRWTDDSWIFSRIPGLKDCPKEICYGTMAVYRISFALAVFHLVLALVLIRVKSSKDCRSNIQDGFWFFKFLFLIAVAVVSFFIPNSFFIGYGWVALIGAGFFILIQLILLVDFAHTWSETWVGNYEESQSRGWAAAILGATIVMFVIALVGDILMYVFFAPSTCQQNTAFITINLILCVVFSIFSVNSKIQQMNPRSGLLQSAVVTLYCTYLVWSAIMAEPDTPDVGCKGPLKGNGGDSTASAFVGVAITFLAVMYSAFSVSGSANEMLGGKDEDDVEQATQILQSANAKDAAATAPATPAAEATEEQGETEKTKLIAKTGSVNKAADDDDEDSDRDDESTHTIYNYTYFHITFALAAMYLCMLLTNWKTVTSDETQGIVVDYGPAAVWVKMVSSWLVSGIYFWTLLAPCLCPDRFNYQG